MKEFRIRPFAKPTVAGEGGKPQQPTPQIPTETWHAPNFTGLQDREPQKNIYRDPQTGNLEWKRPKPDGYISTP